MRQFEGIFRPDTKYKAFFLSMMTFGLAYGLYKGVFDNYLAEMVSMSAFDKGVSEFFRELCRWFTMICSVILLLVL